MSAVRYAFRPCNSLGRFLSWKPFAKAAAMKPRVWSRSDLTAAHGWVAPGGKRLASITTRSTSVCSER